jgi:hypothetical protein
MAVEVISQGFLNNGWWYYSRMQAPSGHVFGITLDVRGGMILQEGLADAGLSAVDAADALLKAWEGLQKDKGTTKPADPNGGPFCTHQGYDVRRTCGGCGGRLPRDWPGAPRLMPDDVDLITEGLQMLAGYVAADVSSSEEILDQSYEEAARIKHGPRYQGKVDVADDETEDLVISGNAFADGTEKAAAIDALAGRLRPYATQEG